MQSENNSSFDNDGDITLEDFVRCALEAIRDCAQRADDQVHALQSHPPRYLYIPSDLYIDSQLTRIVCLALKARRSVRKGMEPDPEYVPSDMTRDVTGQSQDW
jgi:hypothetical protein